MTKQDLEQCLRKIKVMRNPLIRAKDLRCYFCTDDYREYCKDYFPLRRIKDNIEREALI